jgi:hypothetical protein
MDFDPRDDYEPRADERFGPDGQNRGGSDDDRDWDDWSQPEIASRDRDDEARDLGRGPGDSRQSNNDKHGHNPRDAERWPDRDRDYDPRDVFTVTSTCREDASARSFTIEIASTRCAVRNPERWPPSARFEWSPVVISETTAAG